MKVKDL